MKLHVKITGIYELALDQKFGYDELVGKEIDDRFYFNNIQYEHENDCKADAENVFNMQIEDFFYYDFDNVDYKITNLKKVCSFEQNNNIKDDYFEFDIEFEPKKDGDFDTDKFIESMQNYIEDYYKSYCYDDLEEFAREFEDNQLKIYDDSWDLVWKNVNLINSNLTKNELEQIKINIIDELEELYEKKWSEIVEMKKVYLEFFENDFDYYVDDWNEIVKKYEDWLDDDDENKDDFDDNIDEFKDDVKHSLENLYDMYC